MQLQNWSIFVETHANGIRNGIEKFDNVRERKVSERNISTFYFAKSFVQIVHRQAIRLCNQNALQNFFHFVVLDSHDCFAVFRVHLG